MVCVRVCVNVGRGLKVQVQQPLHTHQSGYKPSCLPYNFNSRSRAANSATLLPGALFTLSGCLNVQLFDSN